jgi:hypothetical protein
MYLRQSIDVSQNWINTPVAPSRRHESLLQIDAARFINRVIDYALYPLLRPGALDRYGSRELRARQRRAAFDPPNVLHQGRAWSELRRGERARGMHYDEEGAISFFATSRETVTQRAGWKRRTRVVTTPRRQFKRPRTGRPTATIWISDSYSPFPLPKPLPWRRRRQMNSRLPLVTR